MLFFGWTDTGEDVVFCDEFGIVFGFKRGEIDTFRVFHANFFGNGDNGFFVVTGDNDGGDVVSVKVVDDAFGSGADFVFEAYDAEYGR